MAVIAMLCAVLKSFLRLFTSRKGSLTVEFENQLADSTEKKYQNRKQLVHVLRHWREDKEFARQVDRPTKSYLSTFYRAMHVVQSAVLLS